MNQKYEYQFVRIGEGGWFQVKKAAMQEYQRVIMDYAHQGWRLVQIFAPGTGAYGAAQYLEMIFEREVGG